MRKHALILLGIPDIAATDDHIPPLLCRARECAEIYLLVAKRQKGCDGMGELAMIREEFRESVDKVIEYCKEKHYISEDIVWDVDSAAVEMVKL